MLRSLRSHATWAVVAGLATCLFDAPQAFAQLPDTTTSDAVVATRDGLRTGGCTGCFETQMLAALASFKTVKRVFRTCAIADSGAFATDVDNCATASTGKFQDFILIQGDLRLKSDPNNPGGVNTVNSLGVASGGANTAYRISGNGSGNGFNCAKTTTGGPVAMGFIAPEGFNGVPGGGDDAGGGAFGAAGNGNNGSGAPAAFGATDTAPPMTACTGTIQKFLDKLPAASKPDTAGLVQRCIINKDRNNDGTMAGDQAGIAAPGAITALGANESTNLKLSCDAGFGDVPTLDFEAAATRAIGLNQPAIYGAQIFKIIASDDIHANTGLTAKLQLNDAQIEGLFGPADATQVCALSQLGGVSTVATNYDINNPPPDDPNQLNLSSLVPDVRVCFRAIGSGSRETLRNSFQLNTAFNATIGDAATTVQGLCNPPDINGDEQFFSKILHRTPSTADEVGCVASHAHSFGYVEADRTSPDFYGVPVEGVDPDANAAQLQTLVKCGLYRFWGPLYGGVGGRTTSAGPSAVAHRLALRSTVVYGPGVAYVPGAAVVFNKTRTDANYTIQYTPAPGECPGAPIAPTPIP